MGVVWQGYYERYTRVLMKASPAFPIHFLKIYSYTGPCAGPRPVLTTDPGNHHWGDAAGHYPGTGRARPRLGRRVPRGAPPLSPAARRRGRDGGPTPLVCGDGTARQNHCGAVPETVSTACRAHETRLLVDIACLIRSWSASGVIGQEHWMVCRQMSNFRPKRTLCGWL